MIILIIGGMGPLSSVYFHQRLLERYSILYSPRKDQDYPNIIHICCPSLIEDRTFFLLGDQTGSNPGKSAYDLLAPIIKDQTKHFYIVTPCNTFHSSPILSVFEELLTTHSNTTFINMIDSTSKSLTICPGGRLICLCTSGSKETNLFDDYIKEISYPDDIQQQEVNQVINLIKTNNFIWKERSDILLIDIQQKGYTHILLGCTELGMNIDYYRHRHPAMIFIDPQFFLIDKILKLF
jgi:aspartate/glutamate racemase